MKKTLETERKLVAEPHKRAMEAAQEPYRDLLAVADEADRDLRAKLLKHQQEQTALRWAEENAKRRADTIRLLEEADRKAALAAETGSETLLDQAVKLEERAEKAALAPVVVSGAVRTDTGVTSAITMTWDYAIVDEAAIPRDLCSPAPGKIRARVQELKRSGIPLAEATIPGIQIVEKAGLRIGG